MLIPRRPGDRAAVIEFKSVDGTARGRPARALTAAMSQIRSRDYTATLKAAGAGPVVELAIVFRGKEAFVSATVAHRS